MSQQPTDIAPWQDTCSPALLVGKELSVTPLAKGKRLVVAFHGPYEQYISIDGRAIVRRPQRQDRAALIYLVRRQPAIYAALETHYALVLHQQDSDFVMTDLYDRERSCYLSHGTLQKITNRLDIETATFAYLAPSRHEADLHRQLRGVAVLGEALELRHEDEQSDQVVSRAEYFIQR